MRAAQDGFLTPEAQLRGLTRIVQAIAARHGMDELLGIVRADLAAAMDVRGIAVKLLTEDRTRLRYVAASGLPEALEGQVVSLDHSPVNRRVIEGELFVTGHLGRDDEFQFGEGLRAAGIESVLLVPLGLEGRIEGVLGAYTRRPERFGSEEIGHFQIVASLLAISLENARNEDELRKVLADRARFLFRVTHNCRAPLAAMIEMLEVVRTGQLGELHGEQGEYVRRVIRRARTLHELLEELMDLAELRAPARQPWTQVLDPALLSDRLRRTFGDEARRRGLALHFDVAPDTPPLRGNLVDLEQALENLIANALRYTPQGAVTVSWAPGEADQVRVRVADTGIGVPADERAMLFQEFFRASNAREHDEQGTGLGLAIVRQIVDRHGGRVALEFPREGGTVAVLLLPSASQGDPSC